MKLCESSAELAAEIKISTEDIKKVCFVCTGNTCRSPMAAAVLNHFGRKNGWFAESAGIFPNIGESISENAEKALELAGVEPCPDNDYRNHKARQVTEELLCGFDIICGLTENHAMTLITAFPSLASRITALGKDISDPFGGDIGIYEKCLAEITEAVKEAFSLYES